MTNGRALGYTDNAMLEKAIQLIEKHALGKRVAAAVSGGEDSMALLWLLLEYRNAGKLSLLAVNVDHCIRKNSADDSRFVKEFCRAHGVEFAGEKIDVPALCKQSGRGVECEAHFARRSVFDTLLQSGRTDLIITAHHMRDNAETVLLHLFRGAGLKGLSGMNVLAEGIFRPFLTTQKEEVSAFVQQENIPFVTDETNADTEYNRNYIRHIILPEITVRFPAAERAICRTAEYAAQAEQAVRANLCPDAFCENCGAVSVKEEVLSAPYVFEALRRLGKDSDVYAATVDEVLALADKKPCARVDIGNGIVAAREYGVVTFYRAENASAEKEGDTPFVLRKNGQTVFDCGNGREVVVTEEKLTLPPERGTLVFDADKLPPDCVLRHRKDGDRFTPFGGGSRKLKEYLIDNKVPLRLRDSLVLVCRGNEVLMIAGMQICDAIKVTPQSVRVRSLSLRPKKAEIKA